MVIKKTRVPGCLKFYPRTLTEDKRWLTVTYSWSALSAKGVVTMFRYDGEMTMRFKNTFRGLYYQVEPNRQILLSSCIEGSALMVLVDVRKRAKTFLRSQVFKISAENRLQIYTTKGIAVGFLALEDNTRIQVRSDEPFVMKNQRRLRWNDPAIKLRWPSGFGIDPTKFIISVRDRYADTSWEMFRTTPDPAFGPIDPDEEAQEISLDDLIAAAPVITKHPTSVTTVEGKTVSFDVEALGDDLRYQWQVRSDDEANWAKSGIHSARTATLSFEPSAALNGYQYRCVATGIGGSVFSKAATLTIVEPGEEEFHPDGGAIDRTDGSDGKEPAAGAAGAVGLNEEDFLLDGDVIEPTDEFGELDPEPEVAAVLGASGPAVEDAGEARAEAEETLGGEVWEAHGPEASEDKDEVSAGETDETSDDQEEDDGEESDEAEPGLDDAESDSQPKRVHEMLIVHDPLDLLDDLEGPMVKAPARPMDIYTPEMPEITGSRATNAGISVFWKNDYYTRGYIVMRRAEDETEWTELIRLPRGTAAYTDFDVQPGIAYTYTVKGYAYGRGGVRVWSEFDEIGVTLKLTDAELETPELISVVPQNGGYLVRWFKVEGATGYRVFHRTEESETWTPIGTVSADESAFLDLSVEEGQPYFYTVQAFAYRLNPELSESGKNERGLCASRAK